MVDTSDPGRGAVSERFVELDRRHVDAIGQLMYDARTARSATSGDVGQEVVPALVTGSVLTTADEHQFVVESQLGVVVDE